MNFSKSFINPSTGPPIFPSLFSDPAALAAASVGRFSCAVTGDEIRESGVVTYDVCDVNAGGLRMNKRSGHATASEAGDYLLSFTANMVSSDSQVVILI